VVKANAREERRVLRQGRRKQFDIGPANISLSLLPLPSPSPLFPFPPLPLEVGSLPLSSLPLPSPPLKAGGPGVLPRKILKL